MGVGEEDEGRVGLREGAGEDGVEERGGGERGGVDGGVQAHVGGGELGCEGVEGGVAAQEVDLQGGRKRRRSLRGVGERVYPDAGRRLSYAA